MIHSYNAYYLDEVQDKVGLIFEMAILIENKKLDSFLPKFLNSKLIETIENKDFIYLESKSANELLADILNKKPKYYYQDNFATPEYWLGYVLVYIQWYFNKPFKEILKYYSIDKLQDDYFPYHEMDINKLIDHVAKYIPSTNKLKELRNKKGYSQSDLALLSNVPIRNIRAYEQGSLDISKAQVDTLISLKYVLDCSIEDLII